MNNIYNVDDIIRVVIKRIGINGEGIGYYNKMAVFVMYALPEEEVDVKITEVYPNRLVGVIEEIIIKNKDRIDPFCPYYYECGGCQLQHVKYEKTLEYKRELLIESLNKYYDKSLKQGLIGPTLPSKDNIHYRNKASLPVKMQRGKNKVGIYKLGTNHFLEITDCMIQMKSINETLNLITGLLDKHNIDAYDPKTRRGFVKALSVRCNEIETEIQVSFIMVRNANNLIGLVKELVKLDPRIKSVFMSLNKEAKKQSFFTNEITKLYGEDTINVMLDNNHFLLKPDSFFQLNYRQASLFYNKILELSKLNKKETVVDAYAGAATISHYLASSSKKIYAIELDKASAQSGILSLEKNEINNVSMIQGDFIKALSGLKKMNIDLMVFDPPRTGIGEIVVNELNKYSIARIIYGSCNPVTLAKDLSNMRNISVEKVIPIDMFPWTSHVETAVLLELKK